MLAPNSGSETAWRDAAINGASFGKTRLGRALYRHRSVARLMTMARDTLSRTLTVTLATIEAAVPTLVQAREIVDSSHTDPPKAGGGV